MNLVKKMAGAGLLVAASSAALASPCQSVLSSYSYYMDFGYTSSAAEIAENHPECFAGGGASSNVTLNATAFTQVGAISRIVSSRFANTSAGPAPLASNDLGKGMAAGGQVQPWNVWASVEKNDGNHSYTSATGNAVRGANDVLTSVVGADYTFSPALVAGLSAAFDKGDGWGETNGGGRNSTGTDGYLIAPYLGYQLSKELVADVTLGVGRGEFSAAGGVKAEADRWFAATNLSFNRWLGNLQLTGKLSYMHGEEDYGNTKVGGVAQANTATTNKLDQVRLGAQLGYWMNGVLPYAGLAYSSNVHRASDAGKDPLGRDTFVATVGVNFFAMSNKVTAGLFYSQELSREHSDNQVFAGNINLRF